MGSSMESQYVILMHGAFDLPHKELQRGLECVKGYDLNYIWRKTLQNLLTSKVRKQWNRALQYNDEDHTV